MGILMARLKEEESSISFPFDGGIDNTSLPQLVQPPFLVSSVNTRLSKVRGVPSRAPEFAELGAIPTCHGIVPSGGLESSIAFSAEGSKRIANSEIPSLSDLIGSSRNFHVPSKVTASGVLPGGSSINLPAVSFDTENQCYWSAVARSSSLASYGIFVSAFSIDGKILGQCKLVYSSAAKPTWFSLTGHGANGTVLWYCDVDSSLGIKAVLLDLASGVISASSPSAIYTPVQLGVGQAAVVANDAEAYLVTPHSSTNTTIAVHTVDIPSFTVSTVTKASFTADGCKLDIDQYEGSVLVAAALNASGTNAVLYSGGSEQWSNNTSPSSLQSNDVSCGFALFDGVQYAVLAITDDNGALGTGASNHSGTSVVYKDFATGAAIVGGVLLPWSRPVSKLCQLSIGDSVFPSIAIQRWYNSSLSPTSEGYITDPSTEVLLLGRYTHALVGRFGVDDVQPEQPLELCSDASAVAVDSKILITYRSLRYRGLESANACRYVELDFADGQPRYAITAEGTALIAGGAVLAWDGETLTEVQPLNRPTLQVLDAGGAGPTFTSGTYRFSALHVWVDAKGVLHRSMPAVVRSITGASMEPTAIVAKPLTSRDGVQNENYGLEWYASLQDGTVLYRQYTTKTSDSLYNDIRNEFQQPLSGLDNPIIYTDGDPSQELMAQCPPAALDICIVGERCWIISAERPNELWPSKVRQPGIAYEWASELKLTLGSSCGDAVALAELSGQLLVMTRNGAFIVNGQGPNNLGIGSWGDAQKMSDIPCTSTPSAISTPVGVMFISNSRFARISVQGVAEVPNVDASLLGTVVSAVIDRDRQEVLWLGSEMAYCYNYSLDKWSSWTHIPPLASGAAMGQGGLLVYCDGVLYQATMSSSSSTAQMSWTTGDIIFGGPQDDAIVHEVLVHGRRLGSHGITVTLTPDYGQGTAVTRTFSSSDVLSATSNGQYTLSCSVGSHSLRALKVSIQETGQSGGLGAQPTSVTIVASKNPGTKRDAVKASGRK